MAFPNPVVAVKIMGSGPAGEEILNVLHYASPDPGTVEISDLDTFISNFIGGYMSVFTAVVTPDWDGVKLTVETLQNNGQPNIIQEWDLTGSAGTNPGDSAQLYECLIIGKRTGVASRKGRGRIYVSPIPAEWVDVDGSMILTAPIVAIITPLASQLLETVTGGVEWYPVLVEMTGNAVVNATAIIATGVSRTVGIQRSRRVRLPN